jgi:hypothetical protein
MDQHCGARQPNVESGSLVSQFQRGEMQARCCLRRGFAGVFCRETQEKIKVSRLFILKNSKMPANISASFNQSAKRATALVSPQGCSRKLCLNKGSRNARAPRHWGRAWQNIQGLFSF